jgi:hypothetical protein
VRELLDLVEHVARDQDQRSANLLLLEQT